MSFRDRVRELVYAGFSRLWVKTAEAPQAIADLSQLAQDENWVAYSWDFARKLRLLARGDAEARQVAASVHTEVGVPGAYVDFMLSAAPIIAEHHGVGQVETERALRHRTLFFVPHWAMFPEIFNNPPIQAKLLNVLEKGQEGGTWTVVFVECGSPPDGPVSKMVTEVPYQLPDRAEIESIVTKSLPEPLPSDKVDRDVVLSAFSGLTRAEVTNVGSLSLRRQGRYDPSVIWEMKAEQVNRSGYLKVFRSDETLAQLGGLDNLKTYATELLRTPQSDPDLMPRGLLLTGVPGCGKTQTAKVLGAATRRQTIMFDVRAVQNQYIGQTEERLRNALAIADSMAPCNLVMDEVEKALSGSSPGSTGNSAMSGVLGTLLSYLSDRRTDVFVICTSNDVTTLPPEFSRAERFDAMFFVDLPDDEDRKQIWNIWLARYGLDTKDLESLIEKSENWTGAEIKSACRLAKLRERTLPQIMPEIVPIFKTSGELLQKTREWASNRCLSATRPGSYVIPRKLDALPPLSKPRKVLAKTHGRD